MKSGKLLHGFSAYCEAHPEQRFWQALRNWSGKDFILVWNGDLCDGVFDFGKAKELGLEETFYWE